MAMPEDWIRNAGFGTAGILGLRWLIQVWRTSRRDFQGDQSESTAIKNMKAEITRLAERVGSLEKKLDERDQEVEAERKLRRIAEDDLDQERRRSAALEDRIAELESERGTD
jgi:peptidoglycan hydrolase CwlO-like protein